MIEFFPHQSASFVEVERAWSDGNNNVLCVLPTGAGKTLIKAEMARRAVRRGGLVVVFAHRDVLIQQISDAMCMLGVPHTFIASKTTVSQTANLNVEKHGSSFYDERARVVIASVDAWLHKDKKNSLEGLKSLVTNWFMDEAHHTLKHNKWGKCVLSLPNAQGLGVTATPWRGDKRGLGYGEITGYHEPEPIYADPETKRHLIGYADPEPKWSNDGVFHHMFVGTSMNDLIVSGRLSPYKIYAPECKVNYNAVKITASGDRNAKQLNEETDKADITGDAVQHYLRIANGKRAITFGVSIGHCENVAKAFNEAGITSRAVSSNTPIAERALILQQFKAGEIMNLVNCDLFGEGFDVPSVEVVIMLRRTESYSLFKQQFGRMLRVLEGKQFGILIDHVNNVRDMMTRFNLMTPHDDPQWSLERPTKRAKSDDGKPIPKSVTCSECEFFYLSAAPEPTCPDCGHHETKDEVAAATRKLIIADGILEEMPIEQMQNLIAERNKVDRSPQELHHYMKNAPKMVRNSAVNNHTRRMFAQEKLRKSIQKWCVNQHRMNGLDKQTIQLQFEHTFGVHFMKAQILSERESEELDAKIKQQQLIRLGIKV